MYDLKRRIKSGTAKNRCHTISEQGLEWSQHFSHYKSMGIFPDTQGQLTHKSLVGSCRNLNPFMILWLSLLPARIKKNKSKLKELEWSQDFPHYNSIGAICCHGNQSSDPILPKTLYNQSPIPLMLLMKFDYDWQAGFRDIHVWKCERTHRPTDGQMHARTQARVPYYKLTLSLRLWWAKNVVHEWGYTYKINNILASLSGRLLIFVLYRPET